MVIAALVTMEGPNDVQADLESRGTRIEGTVTSVEYGSKGPDRLVVSYEAGGVEQSAVVYADGLDEGAEVTVLVDPQDETRVGIEGGTQLTGWRRAAALVLLVVGLFVVVPLGVWGLV